jgi:hypothetical protein
MVARQGQPRRASQHDQDAIGQGCNRARPHEGMASRGSTTGCSMTPQTQPRFPIYIVSKGRADVATTPRVLDHMGTPYRIVVEPDEVDKYRRYFGDKVLELDMQYKSDYDLFWKYPPGAKTGPGPARNFAWDHSISEGHDWHWVMDDNIRVFARLTQNMRKPVGDGTIFWAMEDFSLRYENLAMSGPAYWTFTHSRTKLPVYYLNTRIYSCNLIRNDLDLRWRGRYNEDTDLSIRMLKAGWCTVQFNAFLQDKMNTQQMGGGNTEEFYASEGTTPKSQMLVDMHPDVAKISMRFSRVHHFVNYKVFTHGLIKKADWKPADENPYRFRLDESRWKQGWHKQYR